MNFSPLSVSTTSTKAPIWVSREAISAALYAAIEPVTPRIMRLFANGLAILPLIHFPNDAQPVQRQPRRKHVNDIRVAGDGLRQAAGGDHLHLRSKNFPEALDHPLDHGHRS